MNRVLLNSSDRENPVFFLLTRKDGPKNTQNQNWILQFAKSKNSCYEQKMHSDSVKGAIFDWGILFMWRYKVK